MSDPESRRADHRDNVRAMLHGDDLDAAGHPIWSPLDTLDTAGVAEQLADLLATTAQRQRALFTVELTGYNDGDTLNVTAWAKDSDGETDCRDYVLKVRRG